MKGGGKAALVFAGGCASVVVVMLAAKFALVAALGEALRRLPDIQLGRFERLQEERPITRSPLLILGDSTATISIDALSFPDADSLAMVNSTTIEAYYTLKKALDSGATPRCVLASWSFEWASNRKFFWTMFVAGGFYTDGELGEIYRTSGAYGEPPGSRPGAWRELRRFLAEKHLWDDVSLPRLQFAVASAGWEGERMRAYEKHILRHRGSSPLEDSSHYEGPFELAYAADPFLTRTEEEYFRRILRLLAEKRIALYLFEVPFAETVPAAVRDGYWRKYEALVSRAREGSQAEIRFLRPPALPPGLVISAGHLNAAGIQRSASFLVQATAACSR